MTDLIKRDDALAALNSWTYRCDAEDAIRALPAVDPVVIHQVDPAAIREAALREAADACQRIAGNSKDFDVAHRQSAGRCAGMILAMIGKAQ